MIIQKLFIGFAFFLFNSMVCIGQNLSMEVISNTGSELQNNNLRMDFTLGEVLVHDFSNSSVRITEGFHQSDLEITSVVENILLLEINISPNPTTNIIRLHFEEEFSDKLILIMLSSDGRELFRVDKIDTECELDINNYPSGIYYLNVIESNYRKNNIYKIIKQ